MVLFCTFQVISYTVTVFLRVARPFWFSAIHESLLCVPADEVLEASAAVGTPKRSQYEPEVPAETIKQIIRDAMSARGIKDDHIPEEGPFISPEKAKGSRRYFEVKGFAWFSCPKRHKHWPSAHSWCFIDLKKQNICYRDTQKCKKCESTAEPEFTRESIERMAEFVIRRLLGVYNPNTSDTSETEGGPHDKERCGKCKRLGRSCWKKYQASDARLPDFD